MNKICTSLEQSKKLIELGIDINTADTTNRTFYDWQRELEFKNTKHISIFKLFKNIFVNFYEVIIGK